MSQEMAEASPSRSEVLAGLAELARAALPAS